MTYQDTAKQKAREYLEDSNYYLTPALLIRIDATTAQTLTDALDELEEEMGEEMTERNIAKVSDEYIFETEGECIAYNTLHRKLTKKFNQIRM